MTRAGRSTVQRITAYPTTRLESQSDHTRSRAVHPPSQAAARPAANARASGQAEVQSTSRSFQVTIESSGGATFPDGPGWRLVTRDDRSTSTGADVARR